MVLMHQQFLGHPASGPWIYLKAGWSLRGLERHCFRYLSAGKEEIPGALGILEDDCWWNARKIIKMYKGLTKVRSVNLWKNLPCSNFKENLWTIHVTTAKFLMSYKKYVIKSVNWKYNLGDRANILWEIKTLAITV